MANMPSTEEIRAVKDVNQLLMQAGQDAGRRAIEFLTLSNGGGAVAAPRAG